MAEQKTYKPLSKAQNAKEAASIASALLRQIGHEDALVLWSESWESDPKGVDASVPTPVVLRALDLPSYDVVSGYTVCKIFGEPGEPAAVALWRAEGLSQSLNISEKTREVLDATRSRLEPLLKVESLERQTKSLRHAQKLQKALLKIGSVAHSSEKLDNILSSFHQIVNDLMYAENFFIATYDEKSDELKFLYFCDAQDPSAPANGQVIPLSAIDKGPTWHAIKTKKSLRGTTPELMEKSGMTLQLHGEDSFDWLGVPMMDGDRVVGVMVVQTYLEDQRYTQTDEDVLTFVSSHVLAALDRKRSHDDLEKLVEARTVSLRAEMAEREKSEKLQAALYHIASLAETDQDTKDFYAHAHNIVEDLIKAKNMYVALVTPEGNVSFPYSSDEHQYVRPDRAFSKGMTEYVLSTRKPLCATEDDMNKMVQMGLVEQKYLDGAGVPSACWMGVPLFARNDVIGVLAVQSYEPGFSYAPSDQQLLTFISQQFSNSLQRRLHDEALVQANHDLEARVEQRTKDLLMEISKREQAQQQLNHQVLHDPLTGLPNRRKFRSKLDQSMENNRKPPIAVMYLDVDRFKIINDSLGHMEGDQVLQQVANRLSSCVRTPDMVARIAGDEFVVFLENVTSDADAVSVAQRIIDAFHAPLLLSTGRPMPISVSVGVARLGGQHKSADDLLREADTALYQAKKSGRGRWCLFDPTMMQAPSDILNIEGELRLAIEKKQFEVYFQPVFDMRSRRILGYESLLRWNHPTRGVLGPADILPVAESSGLIEKIDWMIFEQACIHGANLPSDVYVTINVSPNHLRGENFADRLLSLTQKTQMPPERLRVEVTEGALLGNTQAALATLEKMAAHGIKSALDDFGTGFSSLNYIKSFPLSMIKIDRSFVQDLSFQSDERATAVISAIMTLSRALRIDVVAEGVANS